MIEGHERTLLAAQGYCELGMFDDALAELDSLPAELFQHAPVVALPGGAGEDERIHSRRLLPARARPHERSARHAALGARSAPHGTHISLQSRLLRMRLGQPRSRPHAPGKELRARQEIQRVCEE